MKKSTRKMIKKGLKKGYQGTAVVGRATAVMGFVIAVIFGIILIAGGIALMVIPSSSDFKDEEMKQSDIKAQKTGKMIGGGFMIGFAVLIITLSGINLYFTSKYKPLAALEGTGTIIDVLSGKR